MFSGVLNTSLYGNIKHLKVSHLLTHFMPLVSFYALSKHQKTRGFPMFSGGIERDQWNEIGYFLCQNRKFHCRCLLQKVSKSFRWQISPFNYNVWKMAKHTLKILRCKHRKIIKVCLAIFQHHEWKG